VRSRDGFVQVLHGEWTKFRTVRSTVWCVLGAIVLTVLLSMLAARGSSTNANDGPHFIDQAHITRQPLAGDGTITAEVTRQDRSSEWAKAGLLIKAGTTYGSPYAAIVVTPDHGVRFQANYDTDIGGDTGSAPRWLRLTRSGTTVTGYESANGTDWRRVGSAEVRLPGTAEAGLFVASPPTQVIEKVSGSGGTRARAVSTRGTADFANVSGTSLAPDKWLDADLAPPERPADAGPVGTTTRAGGEFTLTGTGDIAGYGIASFVNGADDDVVMNSLSGAQIGLMAVIALGVLFATSEFKTGTVSATFAASPRRGRVLVAKAFVVGGAAFVAGLIASVTAFLVTKPALHANGFQPPAYPDSSLTDGPVLRAVLGTALLLALIAVLSLGIGALRRRTVGAVVAALVLVVVPELITSVVSINAALWINRLTPAAGFAIQHTRDRFDYAISPWGGLAVLAAYAAVALGVAVWQLRGRDA
jgi:hypothetical protein